MYQYLVIPDLAFVTLTHTKPINSVPYDFGLWPLRKKSKIILNKQRNIKK
jgi:hypothetical protein